MYGPAPQEKVDEGLLVFTHWHWSTNTGPPSAVDPTAVTAKPPSLSVQSSLRQYVWQPSPNCVLPSSHSSLASRMPSPQRGYRQLFLQLSRLFVLPSSHCSPKEGCAIPLPQTSLRQYWSQPSPNVRLPSSHCSADCSMPSPHTGYLQEFVHPSVLTVFASSQSSPMYGCM